jgi:hypothetical protein
MNVQTATSHAQAFWLFEAGVRPSPSHAQRGKTAPIVVLVASAEAQGDQALDRHLAILPTLNDLAAEFRAADATFDQELERARQQRYHELLNEVEAGRFSRIVAERLVRGWTQTELAARAGMKQPNVARLERVGSAISVKTAKRLSMAFGLADYRELLP